MDFSLSEEHIMIRDAARNFAQTELLPGVIERDENQKFPAEQVKKMGELGFLDMVVAVWILSLTFWLWKKFQK
jgi:alkylation response protein AidB-like acyl-CoA dehydrogenase